MTGLPSVGHIPQLHQFIRSTCDQLLAIRRESHCGAVSAVADFRTFDLVHLFGGNQIQTWMSPFWSHNATSWDCVGKGDRGIPCYRFHTHAGCCCPWRFPTETNKNLHLLVDQFQVDREQRLGILADHQGTEVVAVDRFFIEAFFAEYADFLARLRCILPNELVQTPCKQRLAIRRKRERSRQARFERDDLLTSGDVPDRDVAITMGDGNCLSARG